MLDVGSPPTRQTENTKRTRAPLELCSIAIKHPVIRFILTALFLTFVASRVDWHSVFATLLSASPAWLVGSEIVLAAAVLVQILIWEQLVSSGPKELSTGQYVSLYLQGLFFAHVLPGTVCGDAYRLVRTSRIIGYQDAVGSIIVSRICELFSMLVITLIAITGLPSAFDSLKPASLIGVTIAVGLCGWLIFAPSALMSPLKRTRLGRHVGKLLEETADGISMYENNRRTLHKVLFLGAINWILMVASMLGLAYAVHAPAQWSVVAVAVPMSVATAILPFSFNGVGFREAVLVYMLTYTGLSMAQSVATALLIDVQLLPMVAAGGVLWALDRKDPRNAAQADNN